ncbi:hypothetical protein CHS0354_025120, partial [Potamilus streckersoni]
MSTFCDEFVHVHVRIETTFDLRVSRSLRAEMTGHLSVFQYIIIWARADMPTT